MYLVRQKLDQLTQVVFQKLNQFGAPVERYTDFLIPKAQQHQRIVEAEDGRKPSFGYRCFLASNATITGDVVVGDKTSIMYGAKVQGPNTKIGKGSFIADNCVVGENTEIGNSVTVGSNSVVQGCIIEEGSSIELNSTIEPGAQIQSGAVVAAGSVVPANVVIPSGQIWGGNPVTYQRVLTEQEKQAISQNCNHWVELGQSHIEATLARQEFSSQS
mmetsp:Transcript_13049/g.19712  ORF Transcript_13049/g.19712 Transcript_13049/m.19712 type:complete len:216 (+) Transcript_13049:450-1097(+)|eukprot:CAMPEP_0201559472 /NCGR_PEP_ID=MMETSP0173_2-20130828/74348_1 /ASSEMBLY_ACC=CAM_ASM_000268 /TAXON_ID=218659 /ORGANISM="Vexillifera sp., Strain DIVA3 564/2" /LENGTH=215 /DNA_ID=CAMNT_0047973505 /DNA_START=421 /DNA_END=1068 /DNA_ORIENTATION=+